VEQKISSNYKYVILVSAIFIQICLGATYTWAIFVEPLKSLLHKSQAEVQFPFSVFYNFFPLTMIFSGFVLDKLGIRLTAVCGALLFGTGWMLTGFLGNDIRIITFFIGVVGGIGAGTVYLIPIKVCVQWFPQQKGLATGLAVAGFGGGSALLSHIGRYLMEVHQLSPLFIFKIFGAAFLIIGSLCALLFKSPQSINNLQIARVEVKPILMDKKFRLLYAGMFAGLFGGFAIIANLKQIYIYATPLMGATAVSLFAIFNAVGRITWGGIFDRSSGKFVVILNLLSQALLLFVEPIFVINGVSLYLFASIAGFNYGGVLVIYASEVGSIWGAEKLPKIYGWIFSANIIASISPVFAGFIFDNYKTFSPAFLIIATYILATSAYFYFSYQKVREG